MRDNTNRGFFRVDDRVFLIPSIGKTHYRAFIAMPDLIVLDVRLPGVDGLTALVDFQKSLSNVPIIIMTAFGDLQTAVKAIEGRVFEYLTKPFDLSDMLTAVQRAIDSKGKYNPSAVSPVAANQREDLLLGTSGAMQGVFKRIALASASDCPVLICGESGTGKELVARAIHTHSIHRDSPCLAIAPVSLNPSLIESELFGHEKGAFKGADHAKIGAFELAGNGTILLDEIGDLPLGQQVKLLRVLEQREFLPVGGNKPRPLRARIFAATHRDLRKMVSEGTFREDLYFRLAVFTIDVPPLRERPQDILTLAKQFLLHHNYPLDMESLDESTIEILQSHSWSGNVRELRNAIDHAAILARGNRIYPEHLPDLHAAHADNDLSSNESSNPGNIPSQLDKLIRLWLQDQNPILGLISESASSSLAHPQLEDIGTIYDTFLGVVEPSLIRALLETAQGNRAAVANALGLHRSTLRQKMRRHKIEES